ncbi:MAG: hypothetical protein CVV27_13385 [Candidatus Melainabacteria bacterium HGW-Melainabacteria-1]|nr:MAG: hypothetical protein CVV27_13385 [Candidatus Melainabacteria bacterium HGW-Melainabacteria-1]
MPKLTTRPTRWNTSLLALSATLLLGACLQPGPPAEPGIATLSPATNGEGLTPTSKGERLTPSSKGERLTPSSKGERIWTGRLQGKLLAASDLFSVKQQAVPEALVRIEGTDLQTWTDAEGNFAFPEVPVDHSFALIAEKADADGKNYQVRTTRRIPATQPNLALEALTLNKTGSASGQISLADGTTPEGIEVYLAGTTLATRTDAQGRYALPDIPAGDYQLTAITSGYQAITEPLQVQSGATTPLKPLTLPRESAQTSFGHLTGQILDQGKALAGARVSLVGPELTEFQVTLTDEQGNYTLAHIKPDQSYDLIVSRPFYETKVMPLTLAAGESLTQNLELTPLQLLSLGRLQVKVEDCQGKPVPTALIQLDPVPALGPVPFTDNRGLLTLGPLLPGKYTVYAAKGQQLSFTGILLDNQPTGSDGKPGALAKATMVLGSPCP